MVTKGHRVVADGIHRENRGVRRLVVFAAVEIGERRALDRVAGIEQQQMRIFRAGLLHDGGHLGETVLVGLVGVAHQAVVAGRLALLLGAWRFLSVRAGVGIAGPDNLVD